MAARRLERHLRVRVAGLVVALTVAASACVVDSPSIERTENGPVATAQVTPTTAAAPVFVDPTPAPTAVATATPTPAATSTPEPAGPEPLPTVEATDDVTPSPVPAGLTAIPVAGASFILAVERPVLQLAGHSLIYLDDNRQAEVDIFTPVGDRDGNPIASYQALIDYIETDPAFAELDELDAITIAGLPTRVFEGTAVTGERSFYTDLSTIGNDLAGWFPPVRARMWVIDVDGSPVIVSAESLVDPGQYSDAVRLATEVLSTITFGA